MHLLIRARRSFNSCWKISAFSESFFATLLYLFLLCQPGKCQFLCFQLLQSIIHGFSHLFRVVWYRYPILITREFVVNIKLTIRLDSLPCRNIRLGQRWLITQEIQDKIPFLILDNMYSIDAFNISNLCQLDGYIPCCFEVLDFQVIKVSFIRQASKQTIILRRISWVFILIFNCNVQHDVYIHFLHSIDRSWNIKFLVD